MTKQFPRYEVLELIKRNPGLGTSEIAERMGMNFYQASNILQRLIKAKKIRVEKDMIKNLYYYI